MDAIKEWQPSAAWQQQYIAELGRTWLAWRNAKGTPFQNRRREAFGEVLRQCHADGATETWLAKYLEIPKKQVRQWLDSVNPVDDENMVTVAFHAEPQMIAAIMRLQRLRCETRAETYRAALRIGIKALEDQAGLMG